MGILLLSFIVIFAIQIVFFLLASFLKTDKFMDVSYGMTFVVMVIYFYVQSSRSLLHMLFALAVVLWGMRLAGYLFYRIAIMGRDKHFNGMRYHFLKFLGFWLLQAIIIWMVLLPLTFLFRTPHDLSFSLLVYVGLVLWFIGFCIEAIADSQKFCFKLKYPKGFISFGIWRYSRHPNYFGEILLWWGLFIALIPFFSGWEFLAVLGPLFITFLLLFVTGIPLLEKSYEKRFRFDKRYQEYKRRTSILIPWFRR